MTATLTHRRAWTGPALVCLFLGVLACGGKGPALSTTPPAAPVFGVPASGTTGFPVTASVQNPSNSLVYTWTIAPGIFKAGTATTNGPTVQFTPTAPGTVTLTCVAIRGNALFSPPAQAQVTVTGPAPSAGSFQPAGNLLQGRQGLAAAALPNGTILVTGGLAGTDASVPKSTEIYNPATRTSVAGPAMTTARTGHAMVPLPGGTQFLITGGTGLGTTPASPAAEIYDSGIKVFAATGSMAAGRTGHTATTLASGVLVAGGMAAGAPVNTMEAYNPAASAFAAAGNLPLAPGHTATILGDGTVLLVGHTTSGNAWTPYAAVYDPKTGTLTPTAAPPGVAREGHQALRLDNPARVLILGGDGGSGPVASAEWYDPATRTFSPVGNPMASPRRDFGAAILPSGKIVLLGGTADGSKATATAEVFDPAAGTFTPTGSMGTARRGPSVFTLPTGTILVLGGSNETQGGVAAVETY